MWLTHNASTCVISIVRLSTLEAAATSSDSTWDNTEAALWSYLELTIAIMASCLPTLRPFMAKFFPRFIHSSAPIKGSGGSQGGQVTWGASDRNKIVPMPYSKVSESTEPFSSDPELGMLDLQPAASRGRGDMEGYKAVVAQRGKNETVIRSGPAQPRRGAPQSHSLGDPRRNTTSPTGIRATTVIKQEYEAK